MDSKIDMKRGNLRTAVTWLIGKFGPKRKGILEEANTGSLNAHHNLRNHYQYIGPNTQARWNDSGPQEKLKAKLSTLLCIRIIWDGGGAPGWLSC